MRWRDLIVAMIVDRLVAPRSKLGFVRAVGPGTACTSLGKVLGLGGVAEWEAYDALDWLLEQPPRIETGLAPAAISKTAWPLQKEAFRFSQPDPERVQ